MWTIGAAGAGLWLALAAAPALAACPGETQVEMSACAAAAAKAADTRLNAAYARLQLTPELKSAERAWIAFRDAQCAYEASVYEGGSIQPMTYSLCLERVTKARTAELAALAQDEEYRRQTP